VGEGAPLRQPRPTTGEGEAQEEEKPESAGPSGGVPQGQWLKSDQAHYQLQKAQLTRAQNAKDWPKVIELADAFEKHWEDRGISPPDDWARWARAKEDAQLELRRAPKKPVTPQVPAMEGMTPLGQPKKVEGIKPVTLDEQARKDLGDALSGLMASEPKPEPKYTLKMHAIYHALTEKGQSVEKVAREFSMKPHHVEAIYDAMRSPRPRMALMETGRFR
jgi:hypothetical protein